MVLASHITVVNAVIGFILGDCYKEGVIKVKSSFVLASRLLAVVVGAAAGTASAAPLTFQWNPSGATPALSNSGTFTADNIVTSDFANIVVSANGAFTETGYLPIVEFQSNMATIPVAGLNGTAGATPFGVYLAFTASGMLNGFNPAATTGVTYRGTFSSLNYSLIGDVGGRAVTNVIGTTPTVTTNGDTQVSLASGSLIGGGTNLMVLAFDGSGTPLPSAFATEGFNPFANQAGFFVSPSGVLDLNNAFTNNQGVSTIASSGPGGLDIVINGGGGNGTFLQTTSPIPEPRTLSLMGLGLIVLATTRWARRQHH